MILHNTLLEVAILQNDNYAKHYILLTSSSRLMCSTLLLRTRSIQGLDRPKYYFRINRTIWFI